MSFTKIEITAKTLRQFLPWFLMALFMLCSPFVGTMIDNTIPVAVLKTFVVLNIMGYAVVAVILLLTSKPEKVQIRVSVDAIPNKELTIIVRNSKTDTVMGRFTLDLDKDAKQRMGWTSTVSGDFWKVFLDLEGKRVTKQTIDSQYKKLAQIYHPDKPTGSDYLMVLLNKAKSDAMKNI